MNWMIVLADSLAVFHAIWVAYILIASGLAIFGLLRHKALIYTYGILVCSTAVSNALTDKCLWTVLEQNLREAGGGTTYYGGFASHYLSSIGIHVTDLTVFFGLNAIMFSGLIAVLFWKWNEQAPTQKPAFSIFPSTVRKTVVLFLLLLIVSFIPQYTARAGGGGGGGGGGGIDCTGLIDLTADLVDNGYIAEIPLDPTDSTDDSSGYEISTNGSSIMITAPYAENGETIELTR